MLEANFDDYLAPKESRVASAKEGGGFDDVTHKRHWPTRTPQSFVVSYAMGPSRISYMWD